MIRDEAIAKTKKKLKTACFYLMNLGARSWDLKGPRGIRKRHPRGKNDPAYENLGKNSPEKWGPRRKKFLPVHYLAGSPKVYLLLSVL